MKLAVVDWVDACGSNDWQPKPDVTKDPIVPPVVSVGWVIRHNKQGIWLSSTVSESMLGQTMLIPAGMIKKVRYVGSKYTIKA